MKTDHSPTSRGPDRRSAPSGRSVDRRTVLKGLSAFAALPFFRALEASAAGTGPMRFVGVYHPHGATSGLYRMRTGETETQFDIAYTDCWLKPFDDAATYGRSFKDKVLLLEGVDLSGAIAAGKTGHDAPSSMFTGCGGKPVNPSIDQYLAVTAGLGASTRVTSIVLAVGYDMPELDVSISYGAGGAPLSKIINPVQTFTTLFGGFMPPPPAGDPLAEQRALQQWQQGRSVLDFVNGDLNRLSARLAPTEKLKLDQHATALRDLEKRLGDMPVPGQTAPPAACTVPARPPTFNEVRSWNLGEPNFEQITNLQIDMLAQAMACDVTRFGTLFMNDLSRGATQGTGITGVTNAHDDLAHYYQPGSGGTPSAGVMTTWVNLGKQVRYSYGKAARLLQRCSEFGILDDLGVMMMTDMGDPALHSSSNVPTVLAGGWGGKLRMGRRLKLAPSVSNARLLVSIAQAFGQSTVMSYGNGPNNAGPLTQLT